MARGSLGDQRASARHSILVIFTDGIKEPPRRSRDRRPLRLSSAARRTRPYFLRSTRSSASAWRTRHRSEALGLEFAKEYLLNNLGGRLAEARSRARALSQAKATTRAASISRDSSWPGSLNGAMQNLTELFTCRDGRGRLSNTTTFMNNADSIAPFRPLTYRLTVPVLGRRMTPSARSFDRRMRVQYLIVGRHPTAVFAVLDHLEELPARSNLAVLPPVIPAPGASDFSWADGAKSIPGRPILRRWFLLDDRLETVPRILRTWPTPFTVAFVISPGAWAPEMAGLYGDPAVPVIDFHERCGRLRRLFRSSCPVAGLICRAPPAGARPRGDEATLGSHAQDAISFGFVRGGNLTPARDASPEASARY